MNECAICLEGMDENRHGLVNTPCDHKFHAECYVAWISRSKSCPVCRESIEAPGPYVITVHSDEPEADRTSRRLCLLETLFLASIIMYGVFQLT